VRISAEKGINLIELAATLIVAGIAIPVLISMWATISWRSAGSENVADAAGYARALMEEVRSRRFDQKTSSPWTNSSGLGADISESRSDARTFNDADDYINSTDANITTPAPGYRRWATAEYVYIDPNNTWQSCPLPVTCGAVTNCTACRECCYKRITVNVRRSDRLPGNVTLTTIMSGG